MKVGGAMINKKYYRIAYISIIINILFNLSFMLITSPTNNYVNSLFVKIILLIVGVYNLILPIPVAILGIIFSVIILSKTEVSKRTAMIPMILNGVYIICYIMVLLWIARSA